MRAGGGALLAIVLAWPTLAPAALCDARTDTRQSCRLKAQAAMDRAFADAEPARDAANRDAQNAAIDQLEEAETGVNLLGLASAVTNFLPLLDLTGVTGGAAGGGSGTGVGGALNLPSLGGLGRGVQVLGEVPSAAEVQPLLRQRLAEAGEGEALERLEAALGNLDDSVVGARYNLSFWDFGRHFGRYSGRMASLYLQATEGPIAEARQQAAGARNALDEAERRHADCLPAAFNEGTLDDYAFAAVDCGSRTKSAAARRELIAAIVGWVEGTTALQAQLRDVARQHGLAQFWQLVNNQPQIHLTYRQLLRDPVVGAEAWSVRATLEFSEASLFHFERGGLFDFGSGVGAVCREAGERWYHGRGPAGRDCLQRFQEYVGDNGASLQTAGRWSLSAEYTRIDDLDVQVPDTTVRLQVPGTDKYSAAFSYGRLIDLGTRRLLGDTRLDVFGHYDAFRNDLVRADHWRVALVLTQKVAGVAIPFSLMYRSKSEFDVGPEDDLLTTLGVKLDLPNRLDRPAIPALPRLDLPDSVAVNPLR